MQIHQLDGYIQTIYLVEYPDKLLLLDGCSRADIPLIRKTIIHVLGRSLQDLKAVVVTHMHPDHAGGAAALRKLTGCRVVSARRPHHWYHGLAGRMMHLSDIALTVWVAGRLGKPRRNLWYSPLLHVDEAVTDGQLIPGFEDWQILETPGHTDRDISVLHVPSQRLYVADLIVKVRKRYIPPFPIFHPNKYRASLEKIRDLQPASVMLAHVGEVGLTEDDFAGLLAQSPSRPKTHWRATKARAKARMHQLIRREP